jgi:hypothetical protein
MALPAPYDDVHRVVSVAFDADFYRTVNRDLDLAGADPLRHYATAGWRQGRDPAPWFSSRAYLAANPDVVELGVEPLFHFLTKGRHEGREVAPSTGGEAYLYVDLNGGKTRSWRFRSFADSPDGADEVGRMAPPDDPLVQDRLLLEAEFDAAFYLEAYPDVAAAGMDPLDHFLISGWQEGRNPTRGFSVRDYLDIHPDIAQSGMNPFVHYVRTGRGEGRALRHEMGFRYDLLSRLRPMEARVRDARAAQAGLETGPAETLLAALAAARTGLRDLHVTFSHDDYSAHLGGVQLCLRREAAQIGAMGRDHLHIFPAKPWPVVRITGEQAPLGVLVNGRPAGAFSAQTIRDVLADAAGAGQAGHRSFAIHSLLGHNADEVIDILAAAGLRAGYFWLHDFASLCAGFHLMRNDVEDCGAPPPDSAACAICVYGDWRARHLLQHGRLFERLDLTVASPSAPTLDLWRAHGAFPAATAVVHPHLRLVERRPAPAVPPERPFRLAFAGFPTPHKGWPIFSALMARFGGDPRYAFLHLGSFTPADSIAQFHEVTVSVDRPDAMHEALERLEADAALIWPLCRETFSLSAHEAAAAGAAVITGPDSGNVAAFVTASGHGLVMPDEAALIAAFATGEILALGRARRKPMLYDLAYGGLTADLLAADLLAEGAGA